MVQTGFRSLQAAEELQVPAEEDVKRRGRRDLKEEKMDITKPPQIKRGGSSETRLRRGDMRVNEKREEKTVMIRG